MMSASGFEVVQTQMGTKKKEINNNAQRETASHSGTQQKYVFLKT